jgi:hypothetical protein
MQDTQNTNLHSASGSGLKTILHDTGAGNRGLLFLAPQSFRHFPWLPDLFV